MHASSNGQAMDNLTRKLILQFDDPAAGQRGNAFAMACEHLTKSGQTWRGIAEDIERADEAASLRQDNAKLAAELTKTATELEQHKAAISQWDRAYKVQGAKLAVASAVAWGRTTGRRVAFCVALPVIALLGWQVYERYSWPAAVDEGLRRIAASEPWHDGFGQPAVYRIGNDIYWGSDLRRHGHIGPHDRSRRADRHALRPCLRAPGRS